MNKLWTSTILQFANRSIFCVLPQFVACFLLTMTLIVQRMSFQIATNSNGIQWSIMTRRLGCVTENRIDESNESKIHRNIFR